MKKAFTLIELLVVIAIIAILAAILFPVFTQAKAQAKKIAAVSNAKQNATAVLMYLTDNDDTYPQSAYFITTTSPKQVYSAYDAIWPYTKSKDIFKDPADDLAIDWKTILATKIAGGPYVSPQKIDSAGLGLNFGLFEDPGIPPTLADADPVRSEGSLTVQAETVMFYSARYTANGSVNKYAADYPTWPTTGYLAFYKSPPVAFNRFNFAAAPRHSGQIVVNFCDGHAKSISGKAKLPGTGPSANGATTIVDCYNLPFDLNGVPDVIGEPQD